MKFESILFKVKEPFLNPVEEPAFFKDLNLNFVVSGITSNKEIYNLEPFFYYNLTREENIQYRQDVFKDMENKEVFETIQAFEMSMLDVKSGLEKSEKFSCKYQKEGWFLESVNLYCDAVVNLYHSLNRLTLFSEGLLSFRSYLESYVSSDDFNNMRKHTKKLKKDMSNVQYTLFIKENKIRVEKYKNEKDYSKEILEVFERFRQQDVEDYKAEFYDDERLNHIEEEILSAVSGLFADIFEELENYCFAYKDFLDKLIERFDREIQFYVSYSEYIKPLELSGLKFCYPVMSKNKDGIYNTKGFDIALADKLLKDGKSVVCNDFSFNENERILIITGPNQGGKTTFARAFAQIHYLASLGLKVPGCEARLLLFDNIFTHFEEEESIETLSGKLENDLKRIKEILQKATQRSIIVMNEIFSSTSLQDALFLAERVLIRIMEIDCVSVFVTFLDELTLLSDKIVSLTSTVSEKDVTKRTYKIVRRKADGLSYAISIARKYSLTYDRLKERLKKSR